MIITSKQNPKIKAVIELRRRQARDQRGLTIVDGYEELLCAHQAGVTIATLYYCPSLMGAAYQRSQVTAITAGGGETYEVSREVFEKIAYREGADGWLGVVPVPPTGLERLRVQPQALLLILEAVEKPGNIGAMLRTADAAGVDAVIGVSTVTDWGNPNIIRASKGAVFTVPIAEAQPDELFVWLRTHHVTVVASTPEAVTDYTASDFTRSIALCVGSEKYGHSAAWLKGADVRVGIPMRGKVNSLNVATSAALLLYEAVRQRSI